MFMAKNTVVDFSIAPGIFVKKKETPKKYFAMNPKCHSFKKSNLERYHIKIYNNITLYRSSLYMSDLVGEDIFSLCPMYHLLCNCEGFFKILLLNTQYSVFNIGTLYFSNVFKQGHLF